MTNQEKNLDDVLHILEQVAHFAGLSRDEKRALFASDWHALATLPNPDGMGQLICGRSAYLRFFDLATRWLGQDPRKQSEANLDEFTAEVRSAFSRRFLGRAAAPVDEKNIARMLSRAYTRHAAGYRSIDHFFFCVVSSDKRPAEFSIGPVHFMHRDHFQRVNEKELTQRRATLAAEHQDYFIKRAERNPGAPVPTTEDSEGIADALVSSLEEFLSEPGWIAAVSVKQCDPETSRRRAKFLVGSAFNVLRLLLGREPTDHMRLSDEPVGPSVGVRCYREDGGPLMIEGSRDFLDGRPLGEGWLQKLLERDSARFFFESAGTAITLASDFGQPRPLALRFLEALDWHCEGLASSPPSAVLKFVTALERLLMPVESDEIADNVSKRAAALCHDPDSETFQDLLPQLKSAYRRRSKLAHGAESPFGPGVANWAHATEELSRHVLLRSLSLFSYLGMDRTNDSAKDLDAHLEALVRSASTNHDSNESS